MYQETRGARTQVGQLEIVQKTVLLHADAYIKRLGKETGQLKCTEI